MNLLKNILLIIINIFRTDKVVTDMSIREFENAFKSNFSDYVEHLVIAWYLRNAKTEGLSTQSLPEHMIWMIGDFAQKARNSRGILQATRDCLAWHNIWICFFLR